MRKVSMIFLMLVALISCKKEYTIKVKVYNPVTGEPYAGQRVQLEEATNRADQFGTIYKFPYEGVTDANGELIITERLRKDHSYTIYAEVPENTCYENRISFALFDNGNNILEDVNGNSEIHFEFVPCAKLKLKINNVNCQGSSDKMVLFQGNEIGNFNMDEPWQHDGCVNWESNGNSTVPMGEQYYKWEVTRSGTTNTYYDTIDLGAGEQRIYEINY